MRLYGDVCRRLVRVWCYGEVVCKGGLFVSRGVSGVGWEGLKGLEGEEEDGGGD